jgi:hypothetical protein
MTPRERLLSIAVGGLVAALTISWVFGKYRSAIRTRNNQIATLVMEQQRLHEQRLQGEYANRQMGEYLARSLPGDPERAQSDYQEWLLAMVREHNLSGAVVTPYSSRAIGGLYRQLDFRVQGNTDVPSFVELLYAFYAKDYLHRIHDLSVTPTREGDFRVEMSVDAIALLSAPEDLPLREQPSWRVAGDLAAYRDPILNRNSFQPPNSPPQYNGLPRLEAIVNRDSPLTLTFKDPEGHEIHYELAGPAPEFVRLESPSGTLHVLSPEKQEFELVVRAIDRGFPPRQTEQRLTVGVVDPPPPPPSPPAKLEFDDATQTVLTALVQGRDEWTAWMHVRTRDKTLRLKVGDGFEIGSLKGTVVDVNPRFVLLEIDGRRFTLEPAGNLKDAATRAQED